MNAKKMMTTAVAMMIAAALKANVSVMDVKFTPRTPWNGLVDIEYTIACENPQDEVYVNPVAYDGDRKLTLFMNCLTGDGITNTVKAGKHKMTWDSITDYGVFSSANFQIKMYAGKKIPKYIKIDLSSGSESSEYPITYSLEGPDLSNDNCRTNELWMRFVPPGEFWMGSPSSELGRNNNEDLHHVTLTKPFYMAIFEVTQKQYALVMGSNPSKYSGTANAPTRPVESVTYDKIRGTDDPASNDMSRDCFLTRLRARTHALTFDLPSEARWEYACRAGTMTALYNGKNLTSVDSCPALNEIARNFANGWSEITPDDSNELYGTAKVGSYKPNRLGLYDMLGNVWEVCRDGGGDGFGYIANAGEGAKRLSPVGLGRDAVMDPLGLKVRDSKGGYTYYWIVRGGGFKDRSKVCRSSKRCCFIYYESRWGGYSYYGREYGFRICSEVDF